MSIQMPNNEEKEHSISVIVSNGIIKRKSILTTLPALLKSIGLRNLFFGMEDCIFLACVCAIAFTIVFALPIAMYSGVQYLILFFLSPFFYSLLHMITAWKELQNGTYEIKMTCHYTLRELTALRMLLFSAFSIVLDVLLVGVISYLPINEVSLLQLIGVSLSALFFYGSITLYLLTKGIALRNQLAVPIIWSILCLFPATFNVNIESILFALPNSVVILIFIAALSCYLIQLRNYFFTLKQEVNYAIG